MAGRKPTGPPLVHHLDGSECAKQRMETILETVAGNIPIREACDRLGIEEAMFFRLRTQALQAGLARLEPRPSGRPPRHTSAEQQQIAQLQQELQEKDAELKAMAVRLEIAQAMPELAQDEALKKTTQSKPRRKQRVKRQRSRRK
jgi:transposase